MKKYCGQCMLWQKNLGYCPITTHKMVLYTNADNCKSFNSCVEPKDLNWKSISNEIKDNQYDDEIAQSKLVNFHIYLKNSANENNSSYVLTISEFNVHDRKYSFATLEEAKQYAQKYYQELFEELIK